jgi:transcriptional regulator with XRE-family HTH domain
VAGGIAVDLAGPLCLLAPLPLILPRYPLRHANELRGRVVDDAADCLYVPWTTACGSDNITLPFYFEPVASSGIVGAPGFSHASYRGYCLIKIPHTQAYSPLPHAVVGILPHAVVSSTGNYVDNGRITCIMVLATIGAKRKFCCMNRESLAKKLQILRARKGWGIVEAAEKTGVDRGTLSNLERGTQGAYNTTLQKIARGYGVDPAELIEGPPALREVVRGALLAEREKMAKAERRALASERTQSRFARDRNKMAQELIDYPYSEILAEYLDLMEQSIDQEERIAYLERRVAELERDREQVRR